MALPLYLHTFEIPESLPESESESLLLQLSAPEQDRFKVITHSRRKAEYLLGHTVLRTLASKILQLDPSKLPLVFVDNMKPVLDGLPHYVSLTHSGSQGACVCAEFPVGVDVEEIRDRTHLTDIAEREFTPAEAGLLQEVSDSSLKAENFAALWSLKEALYKAASFSYDEVFRKTSFEVGVDLTITVSESILPLKDWQFRLEKRNSGHYLALALKSTESIVIHKEAP